MILPTRFDLRDERSAKILTQGQGQSRGKLFTCIFVESKLQHSSMTARDKVFLFPLRRRIRARCIRIGKASSLTSAGSSEPRCERCLKCLRAPLVGRNSPWLDAFGRKRLCGPRYGIIVRREIRLRSLPRIKRRPPAIVQRSFKEPCVIAPAVKIFATASTMLASPKFCSFVRRC